MDFIKNNLVGLVAVVIALVALFGFGGTAKTMMFGSTSCQDNTCLTGGLIVSGDLMASSTAMSAAVGCFQLHATSTATWINEKFVTTGATSTYPGTVFWSYGTCTN